MIDKGDIDMSQEVLKIIENMNQEEVKTQLALQCAPLLINIKISNLLIVHRTKKSEVIKLFESTPISYYVIYESKEKVIFFLFIREKLEVYLGLESVSNAMKMFGYSTNNLELIFDEFSKRYTKYMSERFKFPHEIGLLLGYPVEDVIGFIENNGKNYLHTGYWKVYSNLSDAIELFEQYKRAKEIVIKMVSQGINIRSIINMYRNKEQRKESYIL